jgi:hypothetical protein
VNDLDLLREYEPIARFTKGEAFLPMGVEEYVKESSLWLTGPNGKDRLLVPYGSLDVDRLVDFDEIPADHTMYLRYVDEPLEGLKFQRWLLDPKRERFSAPGRLARVPLFFRLADSFFDISLFVRGQVPGGLAAAADLKTRTISSRDQRRVYFGRVVREGGWIALQYLFFYAMNNWRSGFFGVNDHEADWEQIFIFLTDSESGVPEPRWVAYASHDFKGDDLRRRWDDPLLVREGNHPVIFVGAGSHASYFEQGEYLMGAAPKAIQPVVGVFAWLRKFWIETLGMGSGESLLASGQAMLSVPFIDYARGDGVSIGPGQHETWNPVLISDDVNWVHNYRGLWGLDTHDPIGGERAPAGPKYNRIGTIRQSWFDPIGWAGLDKVYPPDELQAELAERLEVIQAEIKELDKQIESGREILRKQALDVDALKVTEYFNALREKKELELRVAQAELQALQGQRTELVEIRLALESYSRRVARGDDGTPTAHLQHVHHPEPPLPEQHRIVEVWSAISVAVILFGVVFLLIYQPANWPFWVIGLGVILGAVEALTRSRFINFLLTIIIILAVIGALILVIEFWIWILALGLAGVALFMIWGNLQELRH